MRHIPASLCWIDAINAEVAHAPISQFHRNKRQASGLGAHCTQYCIGGGHGLHVAGEWHAIWQDKPLEREEVDRQAVRRANRTPIRDRSAQQRPCLTSGDAVNGHAHMRDGGDGAGAN